MPSARFRTAGTILGTFALMAVAATAFGAGDSARRDLGGGSLVAAPRAVTGPGSMLIGLRVRGQEVRVNATLYACQGGFFRGFAFLENDGTFSASAVGVDSTGAGRSVRTTYAISGRISGDTATGSASVVNAFERGGQRASSCSSGDVTWRATRAPNVPGPRGAPAGAVLHGTTTQTLSGAPGAIVLRVARDATRISRALFDVKQTCRPTRSFQHDPRPNIPLDAGGSFSDRVRSVTRTRFSVIRVEERFSGQIGQDAATGILSLTRSVSERRTGRRVAYCSTGTVRWKAAV